MLPLIHNTWPFFSLSFAWDPGCPCVLTQNFIHYLDIKTCSGSSYTSPQNLHGLSHHKLQKHTLRLQANYKPSLPIHPSGPNLMRSLHCEALQSPLLFQMESPSIVSLEALSTLRDFFCDLERQAQHLLGPSRQEADFFPQVDPQPGSLG